MKQKPSEVFCLSSVSMTVHFTFLIGNPVCAVIDPVPLYRFNSGGRASEYERCLLITKTIPLLMLYSYLIIYAVAACIIVQAMKISFGELNVYIFIK